MDPICLANARSRVPKGACLTVKDCVVVAARSMDWLPAFLVYEVVRDVSLGWSRPGLVLSAESFGKLRSYNF